MADQWVTVPQAARAHGVTPTTIRKWARAGGVEVRRLNERVHTIDLAALNEHLAGRATA